MPLVKYMKTLFKIKQDNERGVALILAMMLMMALSLLTINSFEMLSSSINIARNHKDDLQALYIAEAGIEDAILQLRSPGDFTSAGYTKYIDGNSFLVKVTTSGTDGSGNQLIVDIESKGTVAVLYWKEKEM
jgi:Tfp pilus assembly protein PilX